MSLFECLPEGNRPDVNGDMGRQVTSSFWMIKDFEGRDHSILECPAS